MHLDKDHNNQVITHYKQIDGWGDTKQIIEIRKLKSDDFIKIMLNKGV